MNAYLRRLAFLGMAALSLAPAGAASQDLGVVRVVGESSNRELPHAQGFGAFGQVEAAGFAFRLSYLRYSDSTEKEGVVCQVYSPRIACGPEMVSTTARLSGLRADVLRFVSVGSAVQIGGGPGVSFNSVSAESRGVSGQRADLQTPNAGQLGYQATAAASFAPIPGIPLKVVGSYALHWVRFVGCADPSDRTSGYAPFCGKDRFQEVRLGLSFLVPRPTGR